MIKSLTSMVKNRLDHPFFGIYLTTFFIFNYKLTLSFFHESQSYEQKLKLIADLSPSSFSYPFLSIFIWILLGIGGDVLENFVKGLKEGWAEKSYFKGLPKEGTRLSIEGKSILYDKLNDDFKKYTAQRFNTLRLIEGAENMFESLTSDIKSLKNGSSLGDNLIYDVIHYDHFETGLKRCFEKIKEREEAIYQFDTDAFGNLR